MNGFFAYGQLRSCSACVKGSDYKRDIVRALMVDSFAPLGASRLPLTFFDSPNRAPGGGQSGPYFCGDAGRRSPRGKSGQLDELLNGLWRDYRALVNRRDERCLEPN